MFELSTSATSSPGPIRRNYSDVERLYEQLKPQLPVIVDKPPKKKFLLAETKLTEKRRSWVGMFVNFLFSQHLDE